MDLDAALASLRCQVIDAEEARTDKHREALLILAQSFDEDGAILLCEPSVVGTRTGRPPDIAIVDPSSGLHTVEVKGVRLSQVLSLLPGGAVEIQYGSTRPRVDPSRQARQCMFEIKDAVMAGSRGRGPPASLRGSGDGRRTAGVADPGAGGGGHFLVRRESSGKRPMSRLG
jgi:hypothetical protein